MDTLENTDFDTDTFTCTSSCANGEVTVDTDGYYLVTYGLMVASTDERGTTRGEIQIDNVDSEFCVDTVQQKVNLIVDEYAVSASCILELDATDVINVRGHTTGTGTTIANSQHFDVEFLGETMDTDVNLIRVSDNGGSQTVNSTPSEIDWDTEDCTGGTCGDKFSFTASPASTGITINETGLYHISYAIMTDHDSGSRASVKAEVLDVDSLNVAV